MRQQAHDHQPISKKELQEVLTDYPTKEELSQRLDKSFEAFRQENAHQFQLMKEELQASMSVFTNRILTAIDPLMKDLQTREQERAILAAQMKHTQDDVTDLQKRVTKLELADK